MMVVKVVLFFLISATITETAPAVNESYMQLAQTWPPSFCYVMKCNTTNYEERFIIHGLWAHNCPMEPFDIETIHSLEPELNQNWMTLKMSSNREFWEHEWNKHGKCTDFDLFEYFNVTLEAYGRYNLTVALANNNITPGNKYPVSNISRAIHNMTRFRPTVVCKRKFKSARLVLFEVYLCYEYNNPNMVLRNCTDEHIGCDGPGMVELVKKPSQTGNEPVTKDELCAPDKPVEFVQKIPQTGNGTVMKDELCTPDKPVEFVQKIPQTSNEPDPKDEL